MRSFTTASTDSVVSKTKMLFEPAHSLWCCACVRASRWLWTVAIGDGFLDGSARHAKGEEQDPEEREGKLEEGGSWITREHPVEGQCACGGCRG
jgi:hypothetical protein